MGSRKPVERGAERGIYDCDGARRTPLKEDFEPVCKTGMVVLDANVLLNLYRSNALTRQGTLIVLTKLRDRLWVPHQVLTAPPCYSDAGSSVLRPTRGRGRTGGADEVRLCAGPVNDRLLVGALYEPAPRPGQRPSGR
jgi:hypothetical protein